jgi:endonuclease-3
MAPEDPDPRRFEWETVLDRLSAFYHTGDWRRPYLGEHHEDPFQVLVGTILSQRTRDANTDKAAAELFARFPDAERLARAPRAEVERCIHGTGFYRTKAKHIQACAKAILETFHGVVPTDLDALLGLPGVGRKTANCVLVFGYGRPAIPVDTHVHRIANRWGLVRTRTPDATEERLRAIVPERYWVPLNPLVVQHGQNLCRPRDPLCDACPILEFCPTGRARRRGAPTPRPEDRRRAKPRRPGRTRPARRRSVAPRRRRR